MRHIVSCADCAAAISFATRAPLECQCGGRRFEVEIVRHTDIIGPRSSTVDVNHTSDVGRSGSHAFTSAVQRG